MRQGPSRYFGAQPQSPLLGDVRLSAHEHCPGQRNRAAWSSLLLDLAQLCSWSFLPRGAELSSQQFGRELRMEADHNQRPQ
jgi:hypothetical protein